MQKCSKSEVELFYNDYRTAVKTMWDLRLSKVSSKLHLISKLSAKTGLSVKKMSILVEQMYQDKLLKTTLN